MLLTSIAIFILLLILLNGFIKRINLVDEKYSIPDKELITLISDETFGGRLDTNITYTKLYKAINNLKSIPYLKESNSFSNFYSISNLFLKSYGSTKKEKRYDSYFIDIILSLHNRIFQEKYISIELLEEINTTTNILLTAYTLRHHSYPDDKVIGYRPPRIPGKGIISIMTTEIYKQPILPTLKDIIEFKINAGQFYLSDNYIRIKRNELIVDKLYQELSKTKENISKITNQYTIQKLSVINSLILNDNMYSIGYDKVHNKPLSYTEKLLIAYELIREFNSEIHITKEEETARAVTKFEEFNCNTLKYIAELCEKVNSPEKKYLINHAKELSEVKKTTDNLSHQKRLNEQLNEIVEILEKEIQYEKDREVENIIGASSFYLSNFKQPEE